MTGGGEEIGTNGASGGRWKKQVWGQWRNSGANMEKGMSRDGGGKVD
jgi:hypothetical protein